MSSFATPNGVRRFVESTRTALDSTRSFHLTPKCRELVTDSAWKPAGAIAAVLLTVLGCTAGGDLDSSIAKRSEISVPIDLGVGPPLETTSASVRRVAPDDVLHFTATSATELENQFTELGYNLTTVRTGQSAVPPVLLAQLPSDYPKTVTGRARKAMFIRTVLPLVLEANRHILADRARLVRIIDQGQPSQSDRQWLSKLEQRYGAKSGDRDGLLKRVDAIPPSLAIAQAALETGWGASRFVQEGNALYGQWTWSGKGVVPSGAKTGAKYSIRKFSRLYDSVVAYMNNLNRYGTYKSRSRKLLNRMNRL